MDPNIKILIVDDFRVVRDKIDISLKNMGFSNISTAADGIQAIEHMDTAHNQRRPFDLVFLDWDMPRKSGLEVLEHCQNKPEYRHIRFIMVTAASEAQNVITALSAGAVDYIIKPIDSNSIKKKLEKISKTLTPARSIG